MRRKKIEIQENILYQKRFNHIFFLIIASVGSKGVHRNVRKNLKYKGFFFERMFLHKSSSNTTSLGVLWKDNRQRKPEVWKNFCMKHRFYKKLF